MNSALYVANHHATLDPCGPQVLPPTSLRNT